jgi:hypothetical protein
LTNLGSESETCVGSCVHLVGVSISFEKNFYRLPFTPPLSGSPYRSFRSAVATMEPSRGTDMATGSRQVAAAATAVTTTATTTPTVSPAPTPAGGDRAAVVEIPDDDAPPPGWGQWENWPAPAPEPEAGVLVMREDGCVMPWHPTHGAEASSSHAALPAPDGTKARPE